MAKKFWDEKNIKLLKKLHAEGASYSDIAAVFGCTRSAVGGACHRFGLTNEKAQPRRPKQPIRAEDKTLPRNQPKPALAPEKAIPASFKGIPFEVMPEAGPALPAMPDPLPELPKGILLANLLPESCRWPINDGGPFRFCGCRKLSLKGPYCEAHEKRAGGGQAKVPFNPKAKSGLSIRNAVGRI